MYSIGIVSKRAGVTVHALHYYDEIGLLKPAQVAANGRRFYNDANILKLQQIIFLKNMGFTIRAIQKIMEEFDTSCEQALLEQLNIVRAEQIRLRTMETMLQALLRTVLSEDNMRGSILFNMAAVARKDRNSRLQFIAQLFALEGSKMLGKTPYPNFF